MTAVVAGSGLGLYGSSTTQTNGYGGNGDPKVGQGADGAYVNAVTGNLVVQDSDQFVAAVGLNDALSRTYNSLGLNQGPNADQWQFSYNRFLSSPSASAIPGVPLTLGTQAINGAAHGTLVRTVGDGNQESFTYNASLGFWQSKEGSGAYDTITLQSSGAFQFRQGGSLVLENYDSTGKLLSVVDRNGNTQTYNYQIPATSTPAGTTVPVGTVTSTLPVTLPPTQLASISDSSGQTTYFDYTANNLTDIRVVGLVPGATSSSQTQSTVRVRYGYDLLNRLTSVTVDLTPADGSIVDGKVYTTSYQYDGVSDRVTQIAQSDGSVLNIAYGLVGTTYEVQSLTDGNNNKTTFAYNTTTRVTTVTDPLGNVTQYAYTASGALSGVTLPTVNGVTPTVQYGYDADGNVNQVIDGAGRTSTFTYQNGDLTQSTDADGVTVLRAYDSTDQLLTETTTPASGVSLTKNYVYDANENLRFAVGASGDVTEYRYDSKGERVSAISYPTASYSGTSGSFTLNNLATWASQQDQTKLQRTDSTYDLSGQVKSVTGWSTTDANGNGVNDGTQSTQLFVYNSLGQLLTSVDPRGTSTTAGQAYVTSYAYDGLGRQISVEDATARVTTTAYDDVHNSITTTRADGVATTSVYDADGDRTSVALSKTGQSLGTTSYVYDADNHLIQQTDPTGESTYYFYDARGRQVGILSPEGELTEIVYNDDNQEISQTSYATRVSTSSTPPSTTPVSTVMQAAIAAMAQAAATQKQVQTTIATLPTTLSSVGVKAEQTLTSQASGLVAQASAVVSTANALVLQLQLAAQGVANGSIVTGLISTLQSQVAQLQQAASGTLQALQALAAALPSTLSAAATAAMAAAATAVTMAMTATQPVVTGVNILVTGATITAFQAAAVAQSQVLQAQAQITAFVNALPTTLTAAVASAEATATAAATTLVAQAATLQAGALLLAGQAAQTIQQTAQGVLGNPTLVATFAAVQSEAFQLAAMAQQTLATLQALAASLPATISQTVAQVQAGAMAAATLALTKARGAIAAVGAIVGGTIATALQTAAAAQAAAQAAQAQITAFINALPTTISSTVTAAEAAAATAAATLSADAAAVVATATALATQAQQAAQGIVATTPLPTIVAALQVQVTQLEQAAGTAAQTIQALAASLPGTLAAAPAQALAAATAAVAYAGAQAQILLNTANGLASSAAMTALQAATTAAAAAQAAQAQITAFVNALPATVSAAVAAAEATAIATAATLASQAGALVAMATQVAAQLEQTVGGVLANPTIVSLVSALQAGAAQLQQIASTTIQALQALVTSLPATLSAAAAQAMAAATAAAAFAGSQVQVVVTTVTGVASSVSTTALQAAQFVQVAAQAAQAQLTAFVTGLPTTVSTTVSAAEAAATAAAATVAAYAAAAVATATTLAALVQQAAQGVLATPPIPAIVAALQAQVAQLEQAAGTAAQTLQALVASLPGTIAGAPAQAEAAAIAAATFVGNQVQGLVNIVNGIADSAAMAALQAAAAAAAAAQAAQAQITAFVNSLPTTVSTAVAAAEAAAMAAAATLAAQAGALVATATQVAAQLQQAVAGVLADPNVVALIDTLEGGAALVLSAAQRTGATLQALVTALPGELSEQVTLAVATANAAINSALVQAQATVAAVSEIATGTGNTIFQIAASAYAQAQQLQQQIMDLVAGLPTTVSNTVAFAEQTAIAAGAALAAEAGAVVGTALQIAALIQQTVQGALNNPTLVGLENLLQAQVNQLVATAQSTVTALQALVAGLPAAVMQAVQQTYATALATATAIATQASNLAAEAQYLAGTEVAVVLQAVASAQATATQLAQAIVAFVGSLPTTVSTAVAQAEATAIAAAGQVAAMAAQVVADATAVATMIQQTAEGVINNQLLPPVYAGLAIVESEAGQLLATVQGAAQTIQALVASLPATVTQAVATAEATAISEAGYALTQAQAALAAIEALAAGPVNVVLQEVEVIDAKVQTISRYLQTFIDNLPLTIRQEVAATEATVLAEVNYVETTVAGAQALVLSTVANAKDTALADVNAALATVESEAATVEAAVNDVVNNTYNYYVAPKVKSLEAEIAALKVLISGVQTSAHTYVAVLEKLPVVGPFIRQIFDPMPLSSPQLGGTSNASTSTTPSAVHILSATTAPNTTVSSTAAGTITPTTNSQDRTVRSFYDAAGRLSYTVDEDGNVTGYTYDGAGRKIAETQYAVALSPIPTSGNASDVQVTPSTSDRTTRYFYDADGRQVGTLDGAGYLTQTVYDAAGEVSKTIAYATATNPSLASNGTLAQLQPASDPAHDQVSYEFYDGKGQLSSQIDADRYLTSHYYDVAGNQTQQIRYATAVSYSGSGPAPTPVISSTDQTTTAQYDALNRVIQQTDAQGTITSYSFDAATGFLTSKTTAAGVTYGAGISDARTVSYQYDPLGRVTDTVSGDGNAAIANGSNPNTVASTYGTKQTYDKAGRLTSTTDADSHTRYYYYDGDSRLRYTVDATGAVSESQYDAFGDVTETVQYHQLISTSGLTGGLISSDPTFSTLINAGSKQSDALNRITTATYGDNRGLLTQTVDADGFGTNIAYDSFSDVALTRHDVGATPSTAFEFEQSTFDARGERISITHDLQGANYVEQLKYDAFGRLIQRLDPNGNTTSTQYDPLGRTITVTDALGQNTQATYDAFGRVLTQTDRTGNATAYAYSDATQSVIVTTPEGIATTTQTNRYGQTISVTDGAGVVNTYAYDADGNLVTAIADAGGSGHLNLTSKNSYDTADLLKTSTDATGVITAYTYDAANRVLTRTVDPSGLNLQTSYAYDAFGGAIRVTDPTGVVTETVFDNKGEAVHVITDTAGLKLATSYTHDAAGKTLTVQEGQQASGTAGTGVGAGNWTYGNALKTTQYVYDNLERLATQIVDPDLNPSSNPSQDTNPTTGQPYLRLTTSYVYDGNSNLLSKTDPNGNINRYVYDADNRQVFNVDGAGDVSQTVYDAEGRIVRTFQYANPISLTSNTNIVAVRNAVANANNGSVYEGPAAYFLATPATGSTAFYRFLNASTGDSVYTTDLTQANSLASSGYQPHGVSGYIYSTQVAGTVPLYQLSYGGHFYTTNASERTAVISYGGTDLGIAGYVLSAPTSSTITLYRTYGPTGHQFVTSAVERDSNVGNTLTQRQSITVYDADGRVVYSIDSLGGVTGYSYDNDGRVVDTVHYAVPLTAAQLASLPGTLTPLDILSVMNGGLATDNFSTGLSQYSYYIGSGTGAQETNNRLVLTSQSTSGYTALLGNTTYDLSQTRVFHYEITPQSATGQFYIGADSNPSDHQNFMAHFSNGQISAYSNNGNAQSDVALGSYSAGTTYVVEVAIVGTNSTLFVYKKGEARSTGYSKTIIANWPNVRSRIEENQGNNEVAYVDNLAVLSALPNTNPADEHTRTAYDAAGRAVFALNALGNVTQNTYDADGRVTAVKRYAQPIAAGIITNSATIQQNLVTSANDETTQTVYDSAGRATYEVDALNHLTQNIYDSNGRLIQTRQYNAPLPAGTSINKTSIDTQLASSQSIKDDNQDRVIRQVYDTAGRLRFELRTVNHSNVNGASQDTVYVSETRYNAIGWVTDTYTYATPITIDSTTAPTATAVSAAVVTSSSTDEHGLSSYDAAGRLTKATDAVGSTEQYTYDAAGNKKTYTNKNGFVWNYVYDAVNRLRLEVNPTSAVYSTNASGAVSVSLNYEQTATGIIYDAFGEVASRSDGVATANNGTFSFAASRVTAYTYDALGRQVQTAAPSFNVYNATNDANTGYGAARSSFESATTPTSALYVDALGNQIAGRDPSGNYSYKLYDKLGRVAYEVDANRDVTAYTYDAFGNVTALTRELAPISDSDATSGVSSTLVQLEMALSAVAPGTVAARDAALMAVKKVATLVTYLVADFNPISRTIITTYDQLNQKTQVQLPSADTFTTTSSALGGTTATGAPTTTYTYDSFGDTTVQSQLLNAGTGAQATTFSKYDRLGRLTDQIDPLGYYTRNTYDAFSRLTDTVQYATAVTIVPNSTPAFTPPAASAASTSVYSANTSQSTGFNKNVGYDREIRYGYDQLNRKVTQTRVGALVSNLDSSENLVLGTSNLTTTTGYDKVGNVTSVTDENNDVTLSYYDPLGHVVGVRQPARYIGSSGQTVAPLTGFEYDQYGNQIDIERFAENVSVPNDGYGTIPTPQSSSDEQSFTRYDLAGHAIESVDALGNIADTSYDALGHVTRTWNAQTDSAGDAAQTKVETFVYDKAGRQTGTLDVVRNPTQGAAYADLVLTTVQYNAFGESVLKATADRLIGSTTASQDGSAYSDYDADGRVWQTDKDGVDTVYRYDLNGDVTAKVVLPGTVQGANASPNAARLSRPSDIKAILANGVAGTNFIETDYVYDALGRVTQERDPGFTQPVVNATDTGVVSLGQVDKITNPNSPQTWSSTASKKGIYISADNATEYTYGFSNSVTVNWPASIASYGSSTIQVTVNYTLSDGTIGSYSINTTASAAPNGTTLSWSSKGQDSPQPTITSITSAYVKLQGSGGSSQAIRSTDVSGPGIELFTPSFIIPGSFNYQTGSGAFTSVTPTKTASGTNYIVPIPTGSLTPSKVYNYYFTTQESQSNFPSETGINYGGTFTTDANGNIASFGPSTQLSVTTSPVHKQTLDRWGNVISSVDARNGNWVTQNFYDDRNDLIEAIAPSVTAWNSSNTQSETDTPTTKLYYNAIGQKIATDDANGQRTRDVVDASGNILDERHPDGGELTNFYDVLGRKVLSSDGDRNVTTYTYDKKDQLLTQDLTGFGSGQDQITTYAYDESGNRISSADVLGDITRSVYDTRGQLVASLSPLSEYGGSDATYITQYRYDALGRKIGVTNNLGAHSTESWSYDYFGRLTGHTDLAGSAYFYTYDGFGRLANQTSTLPGSSYDGSSLADWQQQIFGGQSGYDNGSWSVTNSYGNAAPAFYGYSVRSNADLLSHNFNLNESTAFNVSFDTAITLNQTNSQAQYFFLSKGNVGPSIFVDFTGNIVYNDGAGNTQSFGGFPNNTAVHFSIIATENANGTYAVTVSITNKANGASIVSFNATAKASGGQVSFASINSTGQRDAHALYVDNILVNGGASSVFQNLSYTYNANGSVQTITDNQVGKDQQVTTYRYDANGNHIGERNTDTVTHTDYENSVISYDALNRLDRVRDAAYVLTYGYDDAGNRIRIYTQYYQSASSASATTQDYWYTYDAENRITLAEGQSSGSSIVQGAGTALSYDMAGNRAKAINYTGIIKNETDYTYTADKQLSQTSIYRTQGSTQGGLADQRFYDRAGRELEDDNYGLVDNITSTTVNRQLFGYNANSELLTQNSSSRQTNSSSWSNSSEISYTTAPSESATAAKSDAGYYDGDGNASEYDVHIDNGNTIVSYLSTFLATGDSEQRTMERVNSAGLISGVTNYIYDAEGNNIEIDNPSNTTGVTQQTLIVDAQGHILQQNQTGANGPQTQNYYYANGNPIGSIGNIDANTFDYNYTPISSTYPAANPGSYVTSGGETVNDIAQAEYGDASLWYIIADANGLSGATALGPGLVLIIPNQVTNVHNTATTFKPYDPNQILGSNTPQLTAPPPPKDHSVQFANILGIVVAVAAAVVLTVVTAGAGGVLGAAAIGAIAAAAGNETTQVTLAIANGRFHYGDLVDDLTFRPKSFGSFIDPASGATEGYDYKGTAIAAAAGAAGGAAGGEVGAAYSSSLGVSIAAGTAGAVASNATAQLLNIAFDRQRNFNFASLAASTIQGAAGGAISYGFSGNPRLGTSGQGGFNLSDPTLNFAANVAAEGALRFGAGVATQYLQIALNDEGKIDFASIAADSFGNAIGNSIVQTLKPSQPYLNQNPNFGSANPIDLNGNGPEIFGGFVGAEANYASTASETEYGGGDGGAYFDNGEIPGAAYSGGEGTSPSSIAQSSRRAGSASTGVTLLDGSPIGSEYDASDLEFLSPSGSQNTLPSAPDGYSTIGIYRDQDGTYHSEYRQISSSDEGIGASPEALPSGGVGNTTFASANNYVPGSLDTGVRIVPLAGTANSSSSLADQSSPLADANSAIHQFNQVVTDQLDLEGADDVQQNRNFSLAFHAAEYAFYKTFAPDSVQGGVLLAAGGPIIRQVGGPLLAAISKIPGAAAFGRAFQTDIAAIPGSIKSAFAGRGSTVVNPAAEGSVLGTQASATAERQGVEAFNAQQAAKTESNAATASTIGGSESASGVGAARLRAPNGQFIADPNRVASTLTRPSLRAGTRSTINGNASTNELGQFVDAEGNVIEDPTYGHITGFENRRIIAAADQRGLTQPQLNDFVNQHPEYFKIEEAATNYSHVDERSGVDALEQILQDIDSFLNPTQ